MTTANEPTNLDNKNTERDIVRFLRDHPDFFEQHLDLLADMILPHSTGNAVSLIERQVSVLRDQKDNYKKQLQQLAHTAEQNHNLVGKLNGIVLALLDARDFPEVLDIIENRMQQEFNADSIVLRLFNSKQHPALKAYPHLGDWGEPALGAFEKVIKDKRPMCGNLKPGQLDALFNDAAVNIGSAALIPLVENTSDTTCLGLLAFGSQDRNRFRVDMDTMFLTHLGKVIARVINQHLSE